MKISNLIQLEGMKDLKPTSINHIRRIIMSGGDHFPYPKHVWAPTGGWWYTPKNANSNFLKVVGVVSIVSLIVFKFGQRKEYVAQLEYDEATINKWEAAAKKANTN